MNGGFRLACVAILAVAAAFAPLARAADSKNCQIKKYGSVELTESNGAVLVPVMLNGKPGHMILNIASAFSAVWDKAIETIPLATHRLDSRLPPTSIGDTRLTQVAAFQSLAIGTNMGFGKGEFLVAPAAASPSTYGNGSTWGFLGFEVFSRVDFELDLAHNRLTLFSQDHCPGMGAYWTDTYASMPMLRGPLGELYVPLELEGRKVAATLSPSNPLSTLTTDVTRRLYGFDENSPGVETQTDDDAGHTTHRFRAMQLTARGLTVKNTLIRLTSADKNCNLRTALTDIAHYDESCMGSYPMHLGRNVLQEMRMYFATKEKMLYFSAADAGQPTEGQP